jgi:lipid A 4'-phosphatase
MSQAPAVTPDREKGMRGILWGGLTVLALLSLLILLTDGDLRIMRRVYDLSAHWQAGNLAPWVTLYNYGPWPAIAVTATALLLLAASIWIRPLRARWRVHAFLVLAMVLGPGLVVNTVFKDHFGRPRPHEIVEFGGSRAFHALGVPGKAPGRSFPSGHASMGFYFLAFFYLNWRRSKRRALAFLAFALFFGGAIGFARMMQGDHFPSDVLWAGGFVFLVCHGLYVWLRPGGESGTMDAQSGSRAEID